MITPVMAAPEIYPDDINTPGENSASEAEPLRRLSTKVLNYTARHNRSRR